MRRKTKLIKSAFPVLALILIGLVTFTGQLHVAMANIEPGTPAIDWSNCIKLARQQTVSPQKPEPLPLDYCYQGLLNKFGTQFLYDISTNPSLIFTYLQQMKQENHKPSLVQLMAQLRFELNAYQLERQELITVDHITVDQSKVNPNVVKGYNAAIDNPLFDQFVKQQLPIISNQTVDQWFTNAIFTSQAIKVQTLCKLTIQNNDPSIDDVLHAYQIAFKTVCPQLVKRFAAQPDIANNVILTVSHVNAAAVTSGNHITLDDDFARQNLKQVVGALIHELTHVVQAGENAPGWFIEGMADYVRSIYGPADDDWSMPPVQPGDSYNDAYRIAARFLHWLDQHTVPTIVDQLSHAAQTGGSFSATFQHLTSDTVDDEWNKYIANSTLAPFKRIPAPDK
jgi:hypothetical protein